MNYSEFIDFFEFKEIGEFISFNNNIDLKLTNSINYNNLSELVYIWVSINHNTANVIYVGSTKRNIISRLNEHLNSTSKRGNINLEKIRYELSNNNIVLIYLSKPINIKLYGHCISPYKIFEDLLIKDYKKIYTINL